MTRGRAARSDEQATHILDNLNAKVTHQRGPVGPCSVRPGAAKTRFSVVVAGMVTERESVVAHPF